MYSNSILLLRCNLCIKLFVHPPQIVNFPRGGVLLAEPARGRTSLVKQKKLFSRTLSESKSVCWVPDQEACVNALVPQQKKRGQALKRALLIALFQAISKEEDRTLK